jgi:hypothetical protein
MARSLVELVRLVRAAQPGENNIGKYLGERGEELAELLGVSATALGAAAALGDDVLAPQLEQLLRQREHHRRHHRVLTSRERALAAAARLVRSARWRGDGAVELDDHVLLGDLLVDTSKKFIAFILDEFADDAEDDAVNVPRALLAEVSRVLTRKKYPDRRAFVDDNGLHVRWNSDRGGLNFYSREVKPHEEQHVLVVVLERPVMVPLARLVPAPLGDILHELGLVS